MKKINTLTDFISAEGCLKSEDETIRQDARRALDEMKKNRPKDYADYYRLLHPVSRKPSTRDELKSHLMKAAYPLPLQFKIPFGLTEKDVLKAFDHLGDAEIWDSQGKAASRAVLLKRAIQQAVDDGMYDDQLVRSRLLTSCHNADKKFQFSEKYPGIREAYKEAVRTASIKELMRVYPTQSIKYDALLDFIDRIINRMTKG